MADEETTIVSGRALLFEAAGQWWSIRQPTCEERDDARAVQRIQAAIWGSRPDVQALADLPPTAGEQASFAAAIAQTEVLLSQVESEPQKKALRERSLILRRRADDWTRADEETAARATLARDRWLTARLLVDEHDKPVCDPNRPDFAAQWEALPDAVRDAARPLIWEALRLAEDARFFSATRSASG